MFSAEDSATLSVDLSVKDLAELTAKHSKNSWGDTTSGI
jgi:hypothetical protein